jgi:hypothetical protein
MILENFEDLIRPLTRLINRLRESTPLFIPNFKSDFESILDASDILVLGDSNHKDPKIYRFVINKVLAAAAKKGFTYISLEVPTSFQKAFDAYYNGKASSTYFQNYLVSKCQQEPHIALRFALLIDACRKCGLKVICADSQDNTISILRDESLTSLERSIRYVTIRASDECNKAIADRTFNAVAPSEKGLFLVGTGHVARLYEALSLTQKRINVINLFSSDKVAKTYLGRRAAVHPILRELLSAGYNNYPRYAINSAKLSNCNV